MAHDPIRRGFGQLPWQIRSGRESVQFVLVDSAHSVVAIVLAVLCAASAIATVPPTTGTRRDQRKHQRCPWRSNHRSQTLSTW